MSAYESQDLGVLVMHELKVFCPVGTDKYAYEA